MKTKVSLITLCLSVNCYAGEIDLTVSNSGSIKYGDATCSDNCKVNTTDSRVLFESNAATANRFSGWSGHMCDYGKGAKFVESPKRISNINGGAKTLQVLDIDNDGQPDLFGISLFSGEITQFVNKGNGEFEPKTIIQNLIYPAALDSIDWNNDGYEDLLVSDYQASVIKVYLNDGNGHLEFSEDVNISGVKPYSFSAFKSQDSESPTLVVSSFFADTSGDLFKLVNSISNEKTAIYKRQGEQYKETQVVSERGGITLDTYLDIEGKLTIVSAEISHKQVATYAESDNYTLNVVDTSRAPYGAGFADIDKDGLQDIVTAHYGPFSLRVAFQEHTFTAAHEIATGNDGLTAVAIDDFDADGLNDIATGEFNSNKFEYYSMSSYVGCGFNKGANATITANFSEATSSTGTPTTTAPTATPESNSSNSGGSVPLWFSVLAGLLFLRRTK